MPIKPITGTLRRGIIVDLSVALGLGFAAGSAWWYGYHLPAVRNRDALYTRLEEQRSQKLKALAESS